MRRQAGKMCLMFAALVAVGLMSARLRKGAI